MSRITNRTTFRANSHNIQKGRVTVVYTNGREDEFDDIDRGEFYQWAATGFDVHRPPYGVRIAALAIEEADEPSFDDTAAQIEAEAIQLEQARLARRARIKRINDEWYEMQRKRKVQ